MPLTRKDKTAETLKDAETLELFNALQSGSQMPNGLPSEQFSLNFGCIFNGIRIVIPKRLQERVLEELHTANTGIIRMKVLARNLVSWRGIDSDIEEIVKNATVVLRCAQSQEISVTSMGRTNGTMAKSPHRLCRTIYGNEFPYYSGCEDKVGRSYKDQINDFVENY